MLNSIRDQVIQELQDLGMETEDASLVDPLVDRIIEAAQNESQALTCAYCGHQYPPGTPRSNHSELTKHISRCEKHPMKLLRDALRAICQCGDLADARLLASAALSETPNTEHERRTLHASAFSVSNVAV
jgi:hypothetical protein